MEFHVERWIVLLELGERGLESRVLGGARGGAGGGGGGVGVSSGRRAVEREPGGVETDEEDGLGGLVEEVEGVEDFGETSLAGGRVGFLGFMMMMIVSSRWRGRVLGMIALCCCCCCCCC